MEHDSFQNYFTDFEIFEVRHFKWEKCADARDFPLVASQRGTKHNEMLVLTFEFNRVCSAAMPTWTSTTV